MERRELLVEETAKPFELLGIAQILGADELIELAGENLIPKRLRRIEHRSVRPARWRLRLARPVILGRLVIFLRDLRCIRLILPFEGFRLVRLAVLGLSILHLLDNPEAVIAKVWRMLKPGGVFVTSTACLGDTMAWFKYVVPVGMFLGLMPFVKIMTVQHLRDALTSAGFAIDHEWQPGKDPVVFIVAKKPVD